MAIRLIIAAGQKRPEHPNRVIVAFERLGQAVAERSCGLCPRPVPERKPFPDFVQLKVDGEIDVRLGGIGHLLKTRAVFQRTKFCTDVLCVLQRRPQKLGQSTCVLRIVHEPPRHPVSFPYLTGVRHTQPNTSPGLWSFSVCETEGGGYADGLRSIAIGLAASRSIATGQAVNVSELGFLLG